MSVVSAQAIVDGVAIELEKNTETGLWEATATAPSSSSYPLEGHYYGVTLTATDEAGNITTVDVTDTELGEALQLIVKETVAPVITITSPTAGEQTSNTTPTIEFTVTDDDSGVDEETIKLLIDGTEQTGVTFTEIDGGYSVSFTTEELEDGEHTVSVEASDHDGNAADTATVTFTINTEAPSLSITSPDDESYINESEITVSGTTDGTSVTVQINDDEPVTVEIVDGEFSQTFELAEGENTITVTATSDTGVSSTITRTVTIDTVAPVFKSVTLTPNPVDAGKTYIISIEVVDE